MSEKQPGSTSVSAKEKKKKKPTDNDNTHSTRQHRNAPRALSARAFYAFSARQSTGHNMLLLLFIRFPHIASAPGGLVHAAACTMRVQPSVKPTCA